MDNNTITQSKKKSLVPTSKSVVEAIQKQEAGFAMVLPPDFDSARFTRIAITAIKTNPKLAQCSRESLLGSLMLSAQFGLEPNSPLHEAVLIPYGNKVEFQVEYRGLLKLAWNSGMIQSIDYNKICENDEYTYSLGFEPVFTHKPELMKERGETIAYYAIAALKDGGRAMVLMSKSEIYDHGKRFSRSFRLKDSPWQTDFDSMAIKTCIRQLVDKKLPKATTKEALLFRSVASADMSIPTVKDIKKDVKLSMDDIEITPGFEEIKPEKPKRAKAKVYAHKR
jgi:recombination protein RecT